jgi:hypothetical protein
MAAQSARVAMIRVSWWVVGVPFSFQLGSSGVRSPWNTTASVSLPNHRPPAYHPPAQEGVRYIQYVAGGVNRPAVLIISNDKMRNCISSISISFFFF